MVSGEIARREGSDWDRESPQEIPRQFSPPSEVYEGHSYSGPTPAHAVPPVRSITCVRPHFPNRQRRNESTWIRWSFMLHERRMTRGEAGTYETKRRRMVSKNRLESQ